MQYQELAKLMGEIHHIKPKSLGGSNHANNLVKLTYREHFLAHKLLLKIYPDSVEMSRAFWAMCTFQRHVKSHDFEMARNSYINKITGLKKNYTPESKARFIAFCKGRTGDKNPFAGKQHTQVAREIISIKTTIRQLGTHHSEEWKNNQSKGLKGKAKSLEHRRKITAQHAKELPVTCPHCGTTGGPRIMKRWHFDNCKHK